MKLVLDMNLSPAWIPVLKAERHEAIHWSEAGPANARDEQIVAWAKENGTTIITHDLDFGAIIAAAGLRLPSVVQLRMQDVSPHGAQDALKKALDRFAGELQAGALISIDEKKARIRILPIHQEGD